MSTHGLATLRHVAHALVNLAAYPLTVKPERLAPFQLLGTFPCRRELTGRDLGAIEPSLPSQQGMRTDDSRRWQSLSARVEGQTSYEATVHPSLAVPTLPPIPESTVDVSTKKSKVDNGVFCLYIRRYVYPSVDILRLRVLGYRACHQRECYPSRPTESAESQMTQDGQRLYWTDARIYGIVASRAKLLCYT